MIGHVHHVGVVLPSADEALGFYRDIMGLEVTEDRVVEEQGVRGVLLGLGENEIELLEPVREDTGVARYLQSRGPTLHHICFSTDDIVAELERLKRQEVELIDQAPRNGLAGLVAFIHPRAMHGVLIELAQPPEDAHTSSAKGFDHLVTRVADIDAVAQTWREVIGLEVSNRIEIGEGRTVGQLRSGQCTIELVGPSSPDSPFARQVAEEGERAVSMVAIEVSDLDAEVAKYRGKGVQIGDPQFGALPNSRTATIPADQAFGLAIQFIEFAH